MCVNDVHVLGILFFVNYELRMSIHVGRTWVQRTHNFIIARTQETYKVVS